MSKSLSNNRASARNNEHVLRNAINEHGRKMLCDVFGFSSGHASKFVSSNKDDAKVNLVSISRLLSALDLKVVPSDQEMCPVGSVAVPNHLAVAALHNSRVGLDSLEMMLIKKGAIPGD